MSQATGTVALAAGLIGAGALAWRRTMSARAVRRAFRAWEAGTGSIYDLMGADTEIVIPGAAPHCGTYRRDVFLRDVAGPFGRRFTTPPIPKPRRFWADAGTIAVLADATGTTRDGRCYANTYVFVFEMAGSRVTRITEFLDMTAFNAVWDATEPGRPMPDSPLGPR